MRSAVLAGELLGDVVGRNVADTVGVLVGDAIAVGAGAVLEAGGRVAVAKGTGAGSVADSIPTCSVPQPVSASNATTKSNKRIVIL